MKSLGGYTSTISGCIDRVLDHFAGNPRAARRLDAAARLLRARVPELRARTQTMLSRVRVPPEALPQSEGRSADERRPLTTGVFAEVELHARPIRWTGRADFLVVSPRACVITDLKTGARDEAHEFQIRVYALLWSRDAELNPTRRLADRLVLAYEDAEVHLDAPSNAELDDMEHDIVARGVAAIKAVSQLPPEARPDRDRCPRCLVRQLCPEYWAGQTQRTIAELAAVDGRGDVEVTIVRRHGPLSWDAVVDNCAVRLPGAAVLLRADANLPELRPSRRVRLLSVRLSGHDHIATEASCAAMIASIGNASEVFLVGS